MSSLTKRTRTPTSPAGSQCVTLENRSAGRMHFLQGSIDGKEDCATAAKAQVSAPRALTTTWRLVVESRSEVDTTMAYAQDTLTLGGSIVERIKAVRAALADRSAKNRVYRQTLRELDGLSDRDLADLGLPGQTSRMWPGRPHTRCKVSSRGNHLLPGDRDGRCPRRPEGQGGPATAPTSSPRVCREGLTNPMPPHLLPGVQASESGRHSPGP